MKRLSISLLLLLSFHLLTAQTRTMLVDSLFQTLHARGDFAGSVIVVNKGTPIYQNQFGLADRQNNIPIDENTRFNTGAVSMAITAVAILQLNEKGMLDIDEPAGKYISGFPYKSITIGHLLSHASGLPEVDELLPDWDENRLIRNQDVMQALYDKKPELSFEPGRSSMFTNTGYIVLAELLNVVTRQEFEVYLQNNIFKPAGMNSTVVYDLEGIEKAGNFATGYYYSPITQTHVEAVKSGDVDGLLRLYGTMGNSNVWSTTSDLLRFCEALSAATILSEESVTNMFLKKTDALFPGQNRSYGNSFSYGWIIPDAPFRIGVARGYMPGYNSEIIWNLNEKRLIIFQSNDYLSFTSYNNLLPYAVGTILSQGKLNIPRKYASIELTNNLLHLTDDQIRQKMDTLRSDTVNYNYDIPGIRFLVDRLKNRGESAKAKLIEEMMGE